MDDTQSSDLSGSQLSQSSAVSDTQLLDSSGLSEDQLSSSDHRFDAVIPESALYVGSAFVAIVLVSGILVSIVALKSTSSHLDILGTGLPLAKEDEAAPPAVISSAVQETSGSMSQGHDHDQPSHLGVDESVENKAEGRRKTKLQPLAKKPPPKTSPPQLATSEEMTPTPRHRTTKKSSAVKTQRRRNQGSTKGRPSPPPPSTPTQKLPRNGAVRPAAKGEEPAEEEAPEETKEERPNEEPEPAEEEPATDQPSGEKPALKQPAAKEQPTEEERRPTPRTVVETTRGIGVPETRSKSPRAHVKTALSFSSFLNSKSKWANNTDGPRYMISLSPAFVAQHAPEMSTGQRATRDMAAWLESMDLAGIALVEHFLTPDNVDLYVKFSSAFREVTQGGLEFVLGFSSAYLKELQPTLKILYSQVDYIILETHVKQFPDNCMALFPTAFNASRNPKVLQLKEQPCSRFVRSALQYAEALPAPGTVRRAKTCISVLMGVLMYIVPKGLIHAPSQDCIDFSWCTYSDSKFKYYEWAEAVTQSEQSRMYMFDDETTIVNKVRKAKHVSPNTCVSLYRTDLDDFSGTCNNGSPFLRVAAVRRAVLS
ncbi:hypothetical protein MRX96_040938 [Rhipicephalus microplus]